MNRAIEALVADAAALGASDVHLDLDGEQVRVRLRVGGRLQPWTRSGAPADGLRSDAWTVVKTGLQDWRVASHAEGERLSLRLHAEVDSAAGPRLRALGLTSAQSRSLVRAGGHPGGLIVVAGKPGSGRRATIEALLSEQAERGASIVSVGMALSDPMVVSLDRARGMAAAIDLAVALDPDSLVLGDLPDARSADRAFQLAASGRRVIVRLDTSDAITAIARLQALKVERFTLAAQLRAVVAQRQAVRLCGECRRPVQASNRTAALLGFDPGAVIYEATGCSSCQGSGAGVPIGVFEVIECDEGIARLINGGADAALLARHAFVAAPRLDSAARALVRDGVIGGDEALRLSRPCPD